MTLTQLNGPSASTGDMVIGELMVGQTSGAVAVFAEIKDATTVRYLPKNNFKFVEGETVEFQESSISGGVSDLDTTSFNISSNYTFGSGQRGTIYNHGFITRKVILTLQKIKLKYITKLHHLILLMMEILLLSNHITTLTTPLKLRQSTEY